MYPDTMAAADRMRRERRLAAGERRRLAGAVTVLDAAITQLEQLNKDGVRKIPAGQLERLQAALQRLPGSAGAIPLLPSDVKGAMDVLFELQDRLLVLKAQP